MGALGDECPQYPTQTPGAHPGGEAVFWSAIAPASARPKSHLLNPQNESEPGGESGFPKEKFAVSAPNSPEIYESKALKVPKSGDSIFRQTHRLTAPAGFGWGFFVWLPDAPPWEEFPKATNLRTSGL